MRIAFLSSSIAWGEVEAWIHAALGMLHERGHDARLAAPRRSELARRARPVPVHVFDGPKVLADLGLVRWLHEWRPELLVDHRYLDRRFLARHLVTRGVAAVGEVGGGAPPSLSPEGSSRPPCDFVLDPDASPGDALE